MGRKAIVFGATFGIGQELTKLLINDGFAVLITGRRLKRLQNIQCQNKRKYIVKQHVIAEVDAS